MNTLRPHHAPVEIPELEIQEEAYRLWIAKGRPEGRDLETWLEAKELLKHRLRADDAAPAGPAEIHFPAPRTVSAPAPRRGRQLGRN